MNNINSNTQTIEPLQTAKDQLSVRVINKDTPDLENLLENTSLMQGYLRFYFKMPKNPDDETLKITKFLSGYNEDSDSFDLLRLVRYTTGKGLQNGNIPFVAPGTNPNTPVQIPCLLKMIREQNHTFFLLEKNNSAIGMLIGKEDKPDNNSIAMTNLHGFSLLEFYAPGHEEKLVSEFNKWIQQQAILDIDYRSIIANEQILENKAALKSLTGISARKSDTMLHTAAWSKNLKAFKSLLEYIPIETQNERGGYTAFHWTFNEKYIDFFKELLALGANLNAHSPGYFNNTPLHSAIGNENFKSALVLITLAKEHGFTLDTLDEYNKTPLHLAAIIGAPEVVKSLIENGAKINERDNMGRTPLHYAALRGNIDIFNSLIAAGANHTIKDKANLLPLDLALPKNEAMLQSLLSQIDIDPNRADDSVGKITLPDTERRKHVSPGKDTVLSAALKGREIIAKKLTSLSSDKKWTEKVTPIENMKKSL